jgi:hypothetical protein
MLAIENIKEKEIGHFRGLHENIFLSVSESYPEVTRLTEPVMDHHSVIDIPDQIEKVIQSHTFPKISSGLIDFLFRCSAIACLWV